MRPQVLDSRLRGNDSFIPLKCYILLLVLSVVLLSTGAVTGTTDPVSRKTIPPVETILKKWAAAMHVRHPREVHFQRLEYDHVFHQEERGLGSFALNAEGLGRLVLGPAVIPEDAVGRSRDGKIYELVPSKPIEYYWQPDTIWVLESATMEAGQSLRYPERDWLGLFAFLSDPKSICPLMLGMTTEELLPAFEWNVDDDWKRRDTEFHLIGKPRQMKAAPHLFGQDPAEVLANQQQFAHLERVEILIDRTTYETLAIRFLDPARTKETVFVIERIADIHGNFWQPDLTGYKVRSSPSSSVTVEESTSD